MSLYGIIYVNDMPLNKKNVFHPQILRHSKKILHHDVKHEEPAQIYDSSSIQDSNYLWTTQDIDSKEFYKKIKSNELVTA